MMMPLLLLNGDATFDTEHYGPVDRDAFLAEVPHIVPACVAGIHEFWRNYRPFSEDAASQEATDASDATNAINRRLTARWPRAGDRRITVFG